ncbi:MAG: hypothetical protein VYA27_08220, partial [Verrucomicrobiota bacterium]|nr:hypothetical protein [Verrucomicrobiota bacterium]
CFWGTEPQWQKKFRIWAIREEDSQRAVMNPAAEFAHLQISKGDGHRGALKGFLPLVAVHLFSTHALVTR